MEVTGAGRSQASRTCGKQTFHLVVLEPYCRPAWSGAMPTAASGCRKKLPRLILGAYLELQRTQVTYLSGKRDACYKIYVNKRESRL